MNPSPATSKKESALTAKLRAATMDLKSVFENEPPELDFVLPGFLAETVGALCAAGSTGKGFWSIEAAMCVASALANGNLLNLDIKKHGRVIILSAEDGLTVLTRRMHFIASHLPQEARAEVEANVIAIPVVGWGVDINNPEWTDAIIEIAMGSRLVILDTHSRWAGGANENDNAQQAAVVMQYERVAAVAKTSVLFLHHVGKTSMYAGKQDEQGAARGASAIVDNARWQGFMQKMTEDAAKKLKVDENERHKYVSWGSAKQNYGAPTEGTIWYERHEEGVLLPVSFSSPKAKNQSFPRKLFKPIQAVPGINVEPGALGRALSASPSGVAAVVASKTSLSAYGG
jgi:RecA-family ATPase